MKNTDLTFVLMAGLPDSGKTTLARALRRELHWHLIEKDGYKEALIDQGIDAEQAGKIAYELSFHMARNELVKQHMSVIFDIAALHTFILDDVMKIMCSIPHAKLNVRYLI
jgi:predicted kinase